MTTLEAGQRVRVNENYAANINIPPAELDETDALGTVRSCDGPYVEVKFDDSEEFGTDYYLFLPEELDPLS